MFSKKETYKKKMMRVFLGFFLVLVFFGGCKSDTFTQTQVWVITSLNDSSGSELEFHNNLLVFRDDGSCALPYVDFMKENSCRCSYVLRSDSIIIESCSPVFIEGFRLFKTPERYKFVLANEKYQVKVVDSMLPLHNITKRVLDN